MGILQTWLVISPCGNECVFFGQMIVLSLVSVIIETYHHGFRVLRVEG